MKPLFTLAILTAVFFTNLFSQTVSDSISLGSGSTKMSFYSLANGEQANENANDWDLQIKGDVMTASVRVNDAAGVQLYELQNGDTAQWSTIDTTGMIAVYNSDTTWEEGAFNVNSTGMFDYGWGAYDQVSHNVSGKKIYVIKTINGNFKKIWIKNLIGGNTYNIAVGNLDNSNESNFTLQKSAFPGKSFFYYAIDAAQTRDIEPAKTAWDIVFRRYLTYVFPIGMYPVTGVLAHPGVQVAEARGVSTSLTDDAGFTYSENISTIGYDWKAQSTAIIDSLFYFVAAQDGNIYKLVFTGYSGLSTGNIRFDKTLIEQASTGIAEQSAIQSLSVYPNPAESHVNMLFTLTENRNVKIRVADITGKTLFAENREASNGLNNMPLDVQNFSMGYYFVSVESGSERLTFRFIKAD